MQEKGTGLVSSQTRIKAWVQRTRSEPALAGELPASVLTREAGAEMAMGRAMGLGTGWRPASVPDTCWPRCPRLQHSTRMLP